MTQICRLTTATRLDAVKSVIILRVSIIVLQMRGKIVSVDFILHAMHVTRLHLSWIPSCYSGV